jgi:CRP-like cAMP-binding protein
MYVYPTKTIFMANTKSLKANQILLQEGEHSKSLYWVRAGQLVSGTCLLW